MRKAIRWNKGFTLVELIVVIAIIGVLASVVIVRYAGKTDQAKVAAAKSQLSQLEGDVSAFVIAKAQISESMQNAFRY